MSIDFAADAIAELSAEGPNESPTPENDPQTPENDPPEAPESPDATPDAEDELEEPEKGSSKAIWGAEDIPDQKVRVKVDGEERILSLRDCVQRGIAAATLHRRMEWLAGERKEVESEREQARNFFSRFTTDGDFLLAWSRRHAPEAFHRAAESYVLELVEEQQLTPEERNTRTLAKERARLEAEREQFESQRKTHAEQTATEAAKQRLGPWIQAAAQRAGLAVDRTFFSLVRSHLDHGAFHENRPATQKDIDDAVAAIVAWRGGRAGGTNGSRQPAPPPSRPQAGGAARSRAPQRAPAPLQDSEDFFLSLRRKHRP